MARSKQQVLTAFGDINKSMWNERRDAEQASPYHLQDNIKAPVLIIASENDTVVPCKDHSRRFHKALKKRKHEVKLIVLEEGEHWRTNEADEITKLTAIESFLEKHIGGD